jgi:hypothetical protein
MEAASAKLAQRLRQNHAMVARLRELHRFDAEARVRAAKVAADAMVARGLANVVDAHSSRMEGIRGLVLAEVADAMDD